MEVQIEGKPLASLHAAEQQSQFPKMRLARSNPLPRSKWKKRLPNTEDTAQLLTRGPISVLVLDYDSTDEDVGAGGVS